jgi:very-short-patch-repair endonuclease
MADEECVGRSRRYASATSHATEGAVAELALRQQGNVTHEQLLALGLSAAGIRRRVRLGRLYVEHRSVYAVGRPARAPLERASAALLACGPGALLSHEWALAMWDLRPGGWPAGRVEVLVPGDGRPPAIEVHRTRSLTGADRAHRNGLAITSVARTLLDCAPHLSARVLSRTVNEAIRADRLSRVELAEVADRLRGHRGARRLRRHAAAEHNPTRSAFEDDFLAFCARFALPTPRINVRVAGREVDAYFPAERVIVECDGWDFHRQRRAFESDRDHDATALALGIATVRITWGRLHNQPHREAERLGTILARRGHAAA